LTQNEEWGDLFKIGSCVNSTAILLPEEKGSSTEIALLKYLQKMNIKYADYREKYPTILKYPFSSSRKRMSILV
jgi:Ca2+ transporting ATPase